MGLEGARSTSWLKRAFHHHTLICTLVFSLLVHAGLITWRFADPESFQRVFEDSALEVVLVNARSDRPPEQAQAIAQVDLAGGGWAPGQQRASSPLPPSASQESGTDIAAMQRQIEALRLQQMRLLSQLKQELSALTTDPSGESADAPERQARQERQQQLARQLAEIEPQLEKTQAGPRKRFIGPATRQAVYALYYDKMRRSIETRGTLNFPQVGGHKLYGQLTMVITVDAQGRLVQTEVAQASGQPLLDQRAVAIVRSAAPFEVFSANMRRQADQLVVVTRFQFSKEGGLDMRMLTPGARSPEGRISP
jgi:protein TonB